MTSWLVNNVLPVTFPTVLIATTIHTVSNVMKLTTSTQLGIYAPIVITRLMILLEEKVVCLARLSAAWIVPTWPTVWIVMRPLIITLMDPYVPIVTQPLMTSWLENNVLRVTSPTAWIVKTILTASNVMNRTTTSSATTSARHAASPTAWIVLTSPSVSCVMRPTTSMMSVDNASTVTTQRTSSWMTVRSVKPATSPDVLTVGI